MYRSGASFDMAHKISLLKARCNCCRNHDSICSLLQHCYMNVCTQCLHVRLLAYIRLASPEDSVFSKPTACGTSCGQHLEAGSRWAAGRVRPAPTLLPQAPSRPAAAPPPAAAAAAAAPLQAWPPPPPPRWGCRVLLPLHRVPATRLSVVDQFQSTQGRPSGPSCAELSLSS